MKKIVSPGTLSPTELDDFLHRGWFRIGQTLITCQALQIQDTLLSTVWTRTDLAQFRVTGSLRRVLRRVEERFSVHVVPAAIDDEHEDLYQRYLTTTDGARARTLRHFLFDEGEDRGLFQTHEVRVCDGDRLVAFSYFDAGQTSLQSLIGVYDPDFARYGLGLYTMLREVRFGVDTRRRFFYAGYVLPGEPRMDYKLRTGAIWFLDDREGVWKPWSEYTPQSYVPPVERLRAMLHDASRHLHQLRIPHQLRANPMFELPVHSPSLSMCLDQPLVLECMPERHPVAALLLGWDTSSEKYLLIHALRTEAHAKNRPEEKIELLVVVEQRVLGPEPHQAADAVLQEVFRG
jgi:arginine-tRNA-protein transferase